MAEVLSVHQLAARFRLPATWVAAQAKAGTLPHLRIGRRTLFNPVAVAEALACGCPIVTFESTRIEGTRRGS